MTSFYDIERARSCKGPQGTLFGRNSIAGAVSIITNKPTSEFEGERRADAAPNTITSTRTAMVNLPLSDSWVCRGNGYVLERRRLLENLAGGDDLGYHQVSSGRASRCATPATRSTRRFTAAYEDREQDPSVYWVPVAGLDEDQVNIDLGDNGFDESDVFELRRERRVGARRAITRSVRSPATRPSSSTTSRTTTRGPTHVNDYRQKNDVDYYSQELRLNSPATAS